MMRQLLSRACIRGLGLSIFLIPCFWVLSAHEATGSDTAAETQSADQSLPRLLDLGAKKCVPCKLMAPILEELEREYRGVMDVEFVDVWQPENQETATRHKIKAIPTQIFFSAKGEELWRHAGFLSKDDILRKWKELGYDLKPVSGAVSPKTQAP